MHLPQHTPPRCRHRLLLQRRRVIRLLIVLVRRPSSSSNFASSSSFSASARRCLWHNLAPDVLALIADCLPSYRLLLPLSSTCRHFYELIHEESVVGVAESNALVDAAS